MDISDILHGINGYHAEHDPFAGLDDNLGAVNGLPSGQADLQALTRAWINERGAPELLPYVLPSLEFGQALLSVPILTMQLFLQLAERWTH